MSKNRSLWIVALVLGVVAAYATLASSNHGTHRSRRHHHEAAADRDIDLNITQMEESREALRVLVQTHPERVIREDLNQMIEDGTVALNFQDSVTENQMNIATAILFNTPNGLFLTLSVSPTMLLDPETPNSFKQMVVYHEYIHLQQQLTHSQPAWLMMGRSADSRMPVEDIRVFVNAEMEAYEAECQFAETIGATDTFDLCQVYSQDGRAALRLAFVRTLAIRPAYAPMAEDLIRIGLETN